MNNHEKPRVLKAQSKIKRAFVELLFEQGFAKITVQSIIERAEVNRSTFYTHYHDKYALLDCVENDFLDGLDQIIDRVPVEQLLAQRLDSEYIADYVNGMSVYLRKHGDLFVLLLGTKGNTAFHSKLNQMVRQIWQRNEMADKFLLPQNYLLVAVVGVVTNLITEWVQSGFQETEKEFIEILINIISAVYRNALPE